MFCGYSRLHTDEVHRKASIAAAKMAAAIQTFAQRLYLTRKAIRCKPKVLGRRVPTIDAPRNRVSGRNDNCC